MAQKVLAELCLGIVWESETGAWTSVPLAMDGNSSKKNIKAKGANQNYIMTSLFSGINSI